MIDYRKDEGVTQWQLGDGLQLETIPGYYELEAAICRLLAVSLSAMVGGERSCGYEAQ